MEPVSLNVLFEPANQDRYPNNENGLRLDCDSSWLSFSVKLTSPSGGFKHNAWVISSESLCVDRPTPPCNTCNKWYSLILMQEFHHKIFYVSTKALTVHQLTVMSHRHGTMCGMYNKRLTIYFFGSCWCWVSCMSDTQITLESSDRFIVEDVVYHSHSFLNVKRFGTFSQARYDASRFLSSMLKCN